MQLFCWISIQSCQQMGTNQVMLKSWQKYEEKLSKKNKHDINVVYDEPPESPSALEVNRAIEVLQQLTLF